MMFSNRFSLLIVLLLVLGCADLPVKKSWVSKRAPEVFTARFETTHGDFEIEAVRRWSPAAVDRLYQLIRYGFYNDIAIFRVVPDYVVQFGISGDSAFNNAWKEYRIPDEPVLQGNKLGTVAFARGGPESRTTQIFINLNDNDKLDTIAYNDVIGFPVVGRVTRGMDNVYEFFDEYGNEPATKQDSIYQFGNSFLQRRYPELDYIETAYIIQ